MKMSNLNYPKLIANETEVGVSYDETDELDFYGVFVGFERVSLGLNGFELCAVLMVFDGILFGLTTVKLKHIRIKGEQV